MRRVKPGYGAFMVVLGAFIFGMGFGLLICGLLNAAGYCT